MTVVSRLLSLSLPSKTFKLHTDANDIINVGNRLLCFVWFEINKGTGTTVTTSK